MSRAAGPRDRIAASSERVKSVEKQQVAIIFDDLVNDEYEWSLWTTRDCRPRLGQLKTACGAGRISHVHRPLKHGGGT